MASESKIAVAAAFFGNLIIAIAKLIAGLASGSAAMIAEAAHSFSDVGNQVLLFVGIQRAERPPSVKHPFGMGKSAYFWPFLVAVLLFWFAGAYAIIEGTEKVRHPHEVGDITLSLWVLAFAFVIEAGTLSVALLQARKAAIKDGHRSIKSFLRGNRDASLLTVIVEDGLALLGLPIAAGALWMSHTTGDGRWDGAGSIAIGVMLMGFALFLGVTIHDLLIGRSLRRGDIEAILATVAADPDIESLDPIRTMHLGPTSALMGASVRFKRYMDGEQKDAALRRLEHTLKEAIPELKYVYLEDHEDDNKE